jgi:hypothetical protein
VLAENRKVVAQRGWQQGGAIERVAWGVYHFINHDGTTDTTKYECSFGTLINANHLLMEIRIY